MINVSKIKEFIMGHEDVIGGLIALLIMILWISFAVWLISWYNVWSILGFILFFAWILCGGYVFAQSG